MSEDLRIYVASLADYNAGRLVGDWIDIYPNTDADEVMEEIQVILDSSEEENAEEYAVHDYESPIPLGEFPDLEELCELANCIDTHGWETVKAIHEVIGLELADTISVLDSGDFYVYADWDEAIDQWIEVMEVPDSLAFYIDEEAVKRDLSIDGYYEVDSGMVVHTF